MINLIDKPVMIWHTPPGGDPEYYLNHQKLASVDEYYDYIDYHKNSVFILNTTSKIVHNFNKVSFSWGIGGECNINGEMVEYPELKKFINNCHTDHIHFAVTTGEKAIIQISYTLYDAVLPAAEYSFNYPAPIAKGAPPPISKVKHESIFADLKANIKSDPLEWKFTAPNPSVVFNYDKGSQPLPYKMGHNVLENYQKLLKNRKAGMKTTPLEVPRSHQTLVIVYGSKEKQGDFYERAARLVGGFNTADTIKAVVITVSGSDVYHGLDFSHSASEGEPDEEEMRAMKNKFVQVVEVRDGA